MNKWKDVRLYYFSGSGNTYNIAKKIQESFSQKGYGCTLEKMDDVEVIKLEKGGLIGLLFPVAIQSTFPNVWRFVENMPALQDQEIFMVDTLAGYSGGVVGPMKGKLTSKGYNCIGAKEILMTSSMQTDSEKFEKSKVNVSKAFEIADTFVCDLINGKTQWKRSIIKSDLMKTISNGKKIWVSVSKKITVNHQSCVKCQVCVTNCPTGSIKLIDQQIMIDHTTCISCMRCINYCPTNAFLYSGKPVIQNQVAKVSDL